MLADDDIAFGEYDQETAQYRKVYYENIRLKKEMEELKEYKASIKTPIRNFILGIWDFICIPVWVCAGFLAVLIPFGGIIMYTNHMNKTQPINANKCAQIRNAINENIKWVDAIDACIAREEDKLIYYTTENGKIVTSVEQTNTFR